MSASFKPTHPNVLSSCRNAFIGVAVLSGLINILYLSGSLYMMEVYDRVLASRSLPTLVGLSVIVVVLYTFQGLFDLIRARILVRVAGVLDDDLSQPVFRGLLLAPLRARSGDVQQPLRDLDQVRAFLASGGPAALFDLPWMPLYLFLAFLFHPWIGVTAVCGALLLISLTILTEVLTRKAARESVGAGTIRNSLSEAGRRNAEVIHAMGMAGRLSVRWGEANGRLSALQRTTSDVASGFAALSKVLRMMLQSAVLGVGAYLVIDGQATGGIMIASSILVARALAPVELAIANWKNFVTARQGWRRLKEVQHAGASLERPMRLKAPHAVLSVEGAGSSSPGGQRLLVQDISFQVQAGAGVGVIGPSASGKSSLARMLVGVWPTLRGKVRLDGAALEQWDAEELGPNIGYLPQDIELFAGTIAQNIARFSATPDPDMVLAAAQAAQVHELVLRLPNGYDTHIGEGGAALSAGQRQRIALARALYGDPFLVVLDEPNSNLDAEGEHALTQAILSVRARGGIVVVIAHRPSALAGVDQVLVIANGTVRNFGPKEEVLTKTLRPVEPSMPGVTPLRVAVN